MAFHRTLLLGLVSAMLLAFASQNAQARHPRTLVKYPGQTRHDKNAAWNARRMSWHGAYANQQYGQPLALVVPPTAHTQTRLGWGVGSTQMIPIYHQFGRAYPGYGIGGGQRFLTTPNWPSHTDQFGVYSIRAPY